MKKRTRPWAKKILVILVLAICTLWAFHQQQSGLRAALVAPSQSAAASSSSSSSASSSTSTTTASETSVAITTTETVQLEADFVTHATCDSEQETSIYVISEPGDSDGRKAVRSSYGDIRVKYYVKSKVYFIVPKCVDQTVEASVNTESILEQDIIYVDQVKSIDSELFIYWQSQLFHASRCSHVPWIVHVHSAILVHAFALHRYLHLLAVVGSTGSFEGILCRSITNGKPIREPSSPYHVSEVDFPGDTYPDYCQSYFTITHSNTLAKMVEGYNQGLVSHNIKLINVHLGMLAKALDIPVVDGSFLVSLKSSTFNDTVLWGEAIFSMTSEAKDFDNFWSFILERENLKQPLETFKKKELNHRGYTNVVLDVTRRCVAGNTSFVVIVHTSPDHFEFRQVIRQTWGSAEVLGPMGAFVIFILGRSNDLRVEQRIREEWKTFGDILQTDYEDTYQTLVFKALTWMQWMANHCKEATWVVKTDDDILTNIFQVQAYLQSPEALESHGKYHCRLWTNMDIIRDPRSKWYISEETFAGEHFPPYCSGSAFILTPEIAQKSIEAFEERPKYFWVDDAFVTGVLAARAEVGHVNLDNKFALAADKFDAVLIETNGYFAHMPGDKNHELRRQSWQRLLQVEAERKQVTTTLKTTKT